MLPAAATMKTRLLVTAFAFAGLAACTDGAVEDEFATDETGEIDETKADIAGTYTFYTVTPDLRRCASPMCGGYWVSRVNRTDTRCFDGRYAASCYVAEIRWSSLGVNQETVDKINGTIHAASVVMRGSVVGKTFTTGRLGEFKPSEAWLGQGPNPPAGPFAIVEDTGVRCITSPCNSMREKKLNSSAAAVIAELGWEAAGVSDEMIGTAITELFVHDLIVAGDRYTVHGPGGTAKARTVTQYYTRARDHKACYVGGCSGEVCSDRPDVVTTCQYRPEYACYRGAVCEEQVEGDCAWTETEELNACLANPPQL
jgi:eight-cysteine-cluster-containing protein